jgi:hypothetical protein
MAVNCIAKPSGSAQSSRG